MDRSRFRALLETLEQQWRRSGAPIAGRLAPGLADEQIDRLTAPLGLRLPADARELFAWHDGAQGAGADSLSIGPPNAFLPLSAQVAQCLTERRYADEHVRLGLFEAADDSWGAQWFPLLSGQSGRQLIVIDCAVPEGEPALVGHVAKEVRHLPSATVTLTEIAEFWLQCFEQGWYVWSPDHEQFLEQSSPSFPPERFRPYY